MTEIVGEDLVVALEADLLYEIEEAGEEVVTEEAEEMAEVNLVQI